MTDEQRATLYALVAPSEARETPAVESTTTVNVGAFAVPLGGMLKRSYPGAPAEIVPTFPSPRMKLILKRKPR